MKALESWAEDSGNRSRRNNLKVVGLPEGAEGQDTVAFTEHMLRTLLPEASPLIMRWNGPIGCPPSVDSWEPPLAPLSSTH